MDLRLIMKIYVLILISSYLCLRTTGNGDGSVVFLDSPMNRYLRDNLQIDTMSPSEIASAVSVMLGFAPSSSVSAESSKKLDKILLPNPFNKPHAVLLLDVRGLDAAVLPSDTLTLARAKSSFDSKVHGSDEAEIEVPGSDEILIHTVDEPLECESCFDKEFADLARLLDGSYTGSMESMNGRLTFTLSSGSSFKLHVSKQADLEYAMNLVSLVHGIKKAAVMHEDFTESMQSPAELLMGTFTGIEALKEHGLGVAQQGAELFETALTKLFILLQKHYDGKIVGIVMYREEHSSHSPSSFDLKLASRISRQLEETTSSNSTTIIEVLLVRRILAWITGIILLVATLIGVYLLVNMPLTRDTLLYANVKLD